MEGPKTLFALLALLAVVAIFCAVGADARSQRKKRAEGLKCVVCNNNDNKGTCEETISKEGIANYTEECGSLDDACVKTVVKYKKNGKQGEVLLAGHVVDRYCSHVPQDEDGCSVLTGSGGKTWQCVCRGNKCNSGDNLKASSLLFFITSALGYFGIKMFF